MEFSGEKKKRLNKSCWYLGSYTDKKNCSPLYPEHTFEGDSEVVNFLCDPIPNGSKEEGFIFTQGFRRFDP